MFSPAWSHGLPSLECAWVGAPRIFLALRDTVRTHSPSFMFLSETKIIQRRAEWIRLRLGFAGCFVVDRRGNNGGLLLLWIQSISISIRSFLMGHIDLIVSDGAKRWRFIGFYGNSRLLSGLILGTYCIV